MKLIELYFVGHMAVFLWVLDKLVSTRALGISNEIELSD